MTLIRGGPAFWPGNIPFKPLRVGREAKRARNSIELSSISCPITLRPSLSISFRPVAVTSKALEKASSSDSNPVPPYPIPFFGIDI